MRRRYLTLDVFCDHVFGGNPLAVVLDAEGLTSTQMQSIAKEFNYSETTFVLPPKNPAYTAQVRIFTPRTELPFAGHPNIGTAVAVANEFEANGRDPVDEVAFEEGAGLVRVRIVRDQLKVTGAELTAPQALSVTATLSVDQAAACLSLPATDIVTVHHAPQVVSVGLPFLLVQLASRQALSAATPDSARQRRWLPPVGTDAIYCYCADAPTTTLHARMFAPLGDITEDPATGSAAAAAMAFLASIRSEADGDCGWRIEQGADMGRPSVLLGRTVKRMGTVNAVYVGGSAAPFMHGWFEMP
jgi:trans-2,3-dihydro-3-hydroxyanthranilate isomerase